MFEAVSTKNNIKRIYFDFIVFVRNKNKNNIIRYIKVIKRVGCFYILLYSLSFMFSVLLKNMD